MDPLLVHLEAAIYRWCRVPPPYGPGRRLVDLWVRGMGTAVAYYPVGVDRLISNLYQDPGFNMCPRAQQLTRNVFLPGGLITVGQLYNFLDPCRRYFTSPFVP